jgi:hypothetical protein
LFPTYSRARPASLNFFSFQKLVVRGGMAGEPLAEVDLVERCRPPTTIQRPTTFHGPTSPTTIQSPTYQPSYVHHAAQLHHTAQLRPAAQLRGHLQVSDRGSCSVLGLNNSPLSGADGYKPVPDYNPEPDYVPEPYQLNDYGQAGLMFPTTNALAPSKPR